MESVGDQNQPPEIFGIFSIALMGHVVMMMVPPENFLEHKENEHPYDDKKRYRFRIFYFFICLWYEMQESVSQKSASCHGDKHKNDPRQAFFAKRECKHASKRY